MSRETDVAWGAGLLEGEASFLLKTDTVYPRVQIHMTDLDVLERVQSIFGGNIHTIAKRHEHWKDAWAWTVNGEVAAKTMELVLPYMCSRRSDKIRLILTTYASKRSEQQVFIDNRKAAAQEYISTDKSLRQVAKQYGISYESVRRAVNNLVP